MARRDSFRRFTGWLISSGVVALLLGVLGVLIVLGGVLYHHCACQSWPNLVAGWEQEFEALYANFATTLIGIAIAVFTIDKANERRAEQQLKAQLIREMGSTDNGIALRAVRELWDREWITDGSLQGANLYRANLQEALLNSANMQGANLHEANLQKAVVEEANLQRSILRSANLQRAILRRANLETANLYGADLQGASLDEANLQQAQGLHDERLAALLTLRGATMPDGSHYDGRYNLRIDVSFAVLARVNPDDPEAMARFYGVPLETYLAGQEWARENLPRLRREAELEQETAETEDAQQPEEPQSAAPSSSAPASPVVPTQSLLSFTVRRLIGLFWPFGM